MQVPFSYRRETIFDFNYWYSVWDVKEVKYLKQNTLKHNSSKRSKQILYKHKTKAEWMTKHNLCHSLIAELPEHQNLRSGFFRYLNIRGAVSLGRQAIGCQASQPQRNAQEKQKELGQWPDSYPWPYCGPYSFSQSLGLTFASGCPEPAKRHQVSLHLESTGKDVLSSPRRDCRRLVDAER